MFPEIVLLWIFGSGIILLFLRERIRREKLLGGNLYACPKCGYDLRGMTPRDDCPECGAVIPDQNADSV